MLYKLCNGDITKKQWIEEKLDVTDYFEFMSLRRFDNYVEAELSRRLNGNGKTISNKPIFS